MPHVDYVVLAGEMAFCSKVDLKLIRLRLE